MFLELINYILKTKTPFEAMLDKISSCETINSFKLRFQRWDSDISDDLCYKLGTAKDNIDIKFNSKNTIVLISQNKEVIFASSNPDEVKKIRKHIVETFDLKA